VSDEPFDGRGAPLALSRALAACRAPQALLRAAGRALPPGRRAAWERFAAAHARLLADGRAAYRRSTDSTPILMYHAFSAGAEPASRFVLPAAAFARQLALLRRLGYQPLRLSRYVELRAAGAPVPRRAVIVTIDDGYRDTATLAAPLLSRHDVPATLFVVSQRVGEANTWDAPGGVLRGRPLLTWDELAALPSELELGSHTRTHVELPRVDDEAARAELSGSRTDIEERTGRPVTTVAYPHGATSAGVEALAGAAGYAGACSARDGLNTAATPLHALRRIEIEGTDSLPVFALKLWLGRRRIRARRR